MKIVIWARVSSKEQKEGYSIDAQLRVTRNKAERMGWEVIEEFAVAESARRGAERQAFNTMVSWVRKNAKKLQIEAILSHKLDRICRNMKDAVRMQEMEDAYGVKLVFVDNEFGPGAAGMLSFNVMAAVAQYYSDNLRSETIKGIEERLKQGWPTGPAAFGYLNVPNKNEPVIPDPEKTQTVIRIFELYATGKYTFKTLAKKLYQEGHVYHKTEPKFGRRSLSYILNNRVYIGELKREGKIYKGRYRLLIDPALFDQCQDILKGKNRRTGNPELLFSGGIFRCAHCGSAMVGEQICRKLKGGGRNVHVYYKCSNNDPDPDHPKVRWKEEDIETVILGELDAMKMPSEGHEWFHNAIDTFLMNAGSFQTQQRKILRKRRTELTTMQDRLLNSYLAGIINDDVFNAKTEQLKSEIRATEKRQDDVENNETLTGLEPHKCFDFTQKTGEIWRGSNFSEKRALLQLISSNRHISDVSVCVQKTKPFDIFAKRPFLVERVEEGTRTPDP